MRIADVAVDGPVASSRGLEDLGSVDKKELTCLHPIDLNITAFAFVVPHLGRWCGAACLFLSIDPLLWEVQDLVPRCVRAVPLFCWL